MAEDIKPLPGSETNNHLLLTVQDAGAPVNVLQSDMELLEVLSV